MKDSNILNINADVVAETLGNFLIVETHKTGLKKTVLGLSGGVDSAVVACLLARFLGPSNVHALIMPFRDSDPNSRKHAELLAKKIGVSYEATDITPMIDAFFAHDPEADVLRKGNKMARERMCLLYDYSAREKALVIGTSNKTEILLGYGTIFGDTACAINPIGDLYKTQIWQLAEYLDVPAEICNKPPSADLWIGQTDEEELGYTYQEIDRLLYQLIDMGYSDGFLQENGCSADAVADIKNRIQQNRFKSRLPVIAKVNDHAINHDSKAAKDKNN